MRQLRAELLTSELHDDGEWHARYPSAELTLCGRPVLSVRQLGRRWLPTCGRCSRAARLFDQIDGSMPAFWKPTYGGVEDDGARGS